MAHSANVESALVLAELTRQFSGAVTDLGIVGPIGGRVVQILELTFQSLDLEHSPQLVIRLFHPVHAPQGLGQLEVGVAVQRFQLSGLG